MGFWDDFKCGLTLFLACDNGSGNTPTSNIDEKAISTVLNEAVANNIMDCTSGTSGGPGNLVSIDLSNADNVIIDNLSIFQNNKEAVNCFYNVKNQQKISNQLQQRLTAMAQASGAKMSGMFGLLNAGITGDANITATEIANVTQKSIINNINKCHPKALANQVNIKATGAHDIILTNINIDQDASSLITCSYAADNMQDLKDTIDQIEKATAAAGKAASKGKMTGIFRVIIILAVVVAMLALGRILYGKYKQYKASKAE